MLDVVLQGWPGGSPENTALIGALIAAGYLVVLWISAVVWTVRDISQRTSDPWAQTVYALIVLIFNFPGLVVYRVLRPTLTLQEAEEHRLESSALMRELEQSPPCPRCGGEIASDYLACPTCGMSVRSGCTRCDRVLEPSWRLCPWCLEPAKLTIGDPFGEPLDGPDAPYAAIANDLDPAQEPSMFTADEAEAEDDAPPFLTSDPDPTLSDESGSVESDATGAPNASSSRVSPFG